MPAPTTNSHNHKLAYVCAHEYICRSHVCADLAPRSEVPSSRVTELAGLAARKLIQLNGDRGGHLHMG